MRDSWKRTFILVERMGTVVPIISQTFGEVLPYVSYIGQKVEIVTILDWNKLCFAFWPAIEYVVWIKLFLIKIGESESPSQFKSLCKRKPFQVNWGHVWELCTKFKGTEIGYRCFDQIWNRVSHILVWRKVTLATHTPAKTLGKYSHPTWAQITVLPAELGDIIILSCFNVVNREVFKCSSWLDSFWPILQGGKTR